MSTLSTLCRSRCLLLLSFCWLGLLFFAVWSTSAPLYAQGQGVVEEIRTIYPNEWGVPHPSGLVFSTDQNQYYLLHEKGNRNAGEAVGTTIVALTPYDDLVDSVDVPELNYEEMNVAIEADAKRFFVYDRATKELVQYALDADGELDPTSEERFDFATLNLRRPEGMFLDEASNTLYILDRQAKRLVLVTPRNETGFNDYTFVTMNIAKLGISDLQSLAIHPQNHNIYIVSPSKARLIQLTPTGDKVRHYNLKKLGLRAPRGIAFAPSADLTDKKDTIHLYIADYGRPNRNEPGKILEVALDPPKTAQNREMAINDIPLFLVQQTELSQWSPPSPDPAGIAYISSQNRFLISDSEVNEIPALFTGNNLFAAELTGTLVYTSSTTAYSNEPTGVGYNPTNQHIFISDDNFKEIYEIDPSSDTLYGTGDDIVTSFDTAVFNSMDPEGVTFDPASGDLFIVDGINNEVYKVQAGTNGTFDGVPAAGGDDVVTHFDILHLGIQDPEGIHFDTLTGNLLIVGKSDEEIYEVTTSGSIANIYDPTVVNADKFAGITLAPGSLDPTVTNLYVVDRNKDNNSNPTENDGLLYEFTREISIGNLFVSSSSGGSANGVLFRDEDIVSYDTVSGAWSLYFDGSDVGVTTDIDAFANLDNGSILMSFNKTTDVPGVGIVDDSDIVRFIPQFLGTSTSGTFEWYLDGSDVELTTNSEDIDAITVVSDTLFVSTLGSPVVSGVSSSRDEDLIAFTPIQLGEVTSGTWSLHFDGSDVGLTTSGEDVFGVSIDAATDEIYLTTKNAFDANGFTGLQEDIFICNPTSVGTSTACNFSTFWNGATEGFAGELIDGIDVVDAEAMVNLRRLVALGPEPADTEDGQDNDPNEPLEHVADESDLFDEIGDGEGMNYLFLPLIER